MTKLREIVLLSAIVLGGFFGANCGESHEPATAPGDACLCSGGAFGGTCVCKNGLVCNIEKAGSLPAHCDAPHSDPDGTKCNADDQCKSEHCVSGVCGSPP